MKEMKALPLLCQERAPHLKVRKYMVKIAHTVRKEMVRIYLIVCRK